ncbi:MAG: hypothetical protein KKC46_13660 [Proteobacteria bacterium]|nr:hypothetical protein [Pseudomonadota bacterium]
MDKSTDDNNGQVVIEKRPSLKNRLEVLSWLKSQGCQIGKTKIYADSESGKLRLQPDGSILLADVELYKQAYLSPRKKAFAVAGIEILQRENLELDAEIKREKKAKLQWEREKEIGKYILRDDFEMEVTARAIVLDASLKQMVSLKALDWVSIVQGNHKLVKDMTDAILRCIEEALNDYANTDKFQVVFQKEE